MAMLTLSDVGILKNLASSATAEVAKNNSVSSGSVKETVHPLNSAMPVEKQKSDKDISSLKDHIFENAKHTYEIGVGVSFTDIDESVINEALYNDFKDKCVESLKKYVKVFAGEEFSNGVKEDNMQFIVIYSDKKSDDIFSLVGIDNYMIVGKDKFNALSKNDFSDFGKTCNENKDKKGNQLVAAGKPNAMLAKIAYTIGQTI